MCDMRKATEYHSEGAQISDSEKEGAGSNQSPEMSDSNEEIN